MTYRARRFYAVIMNALTGGRARLRWVHLLLGGALLMPYYLLANVLVSFLITARGIFSSTGATFLSFAVALPLAAVSTAVFPQLRPLECAAARTLLRVPEAELATGTAGSWGSRGRTAAYYGLHLAAGGVVSGMSLAAPPFALFLMTMPVTGVHAPWTWLGPLEHTPWSWLAPLAGAALLLLVLATSWAAGALLSRCAPALLGPSTAERIAAAEERALRLALRNRLARELHDSVGHALSAVTLQAGAARRVFDSDPAFARQALAAIEETARDAVGELDAVLGLLREEGPAPTAPAPTLAALGALVERTRAAGSTVTLAAPDPPSLEAVPPVVSREAYRMVQEGLTNALRHAGHVPVSLHLALDEEVLCVTVENPVAERAARRTGGGRGLPGIAERARLLRGSAEWGEREGVWRLSARLPLGGG